MNDFSLVAAALSAGQRQKVAFLNDTGFIGGAGVAHRRQIQSFLLGGHDVVGICWLENSQSDPMPLRGAEFPGRWLGLHSLPNIHRNQGLSNGEIARRIATTLLDQAPDLVVVGNLHWAAWPVDVVEAISKVGIPVVAYLHDCHWLTGRCAYTGACTDYLTGCDQDCPTSSEYPPAAPSEIAGQWRDRRRVFAKSGGVPLFANSCWMQSMAAAAFGSKAAVYKVPLGLDERLFAPIDRQLARRLLGLPRDGILILAGAVNLKEARKSGPTFERVLDEVKARNIGRVVTFGARSDEYPGVISLGQIQDERVMPLLYSAADFLVHTAQEESFGQTLMEAAACALPSVVFASGGIVDIAREGENAMTVSAFDTDGYVDAVLEMAASGDRRSMLGAGGRRIVLGEYTLACQYRSWREHIGSLATGCDPPNFSKEMPDDKFAA